MSIEIIYLLVFIIFAILTFVGIPGPIFIAIGVLIYSIQTGFTAFSTLSIVIFFILGLIGALIDNVFALLGAKRFGASKYGLIGAFIGLLTIFVVGPFGLILGPPLGAFIGEKFIDKKPTEQAVNAAFGAVIGFITGAFAKVVIAIAMVIWFGTTVF